MTENQEANKALFGQLERDFEDPRVSEPRGCRYTPWGEPIHFGRSIEERLGNHFQFIPEKGRKNSMRNQVHPVPWHFHARLGPPARNSKLNPLYQTRFI